MRQCPLLVWPGLLVLAEPWLTWFKLRVEGLDPMGVSQHEASGNTLPLGGCGLPGGSGIPLWADEGEAQSELNGEYIYKKKNILYTAIAQSFLGRGDCA